jgi:hypothetical protein
MTLMAQPSDKRSLLITVCPSAAFEPDRRRGIHT